MTGVLLYNIGKEKLPKIRWILYQLGLRAREVSPAEFDQPIGYLAGLEGIESRNEQAGEPFSSEMLVMCSLSSSQFSAFLGALRQNRVPVALKAVLTETNAHWSSARLHRELQAEHAALQTVSAKDAKKCSPHPKK